jgi:hypothetical protein
LHPRFAPGLTITSDWYSIKIHDAIASQSATQILSLCAVQGGVFCDLVQRDPVTGQVRNLIQGAQNLNSIETSGVDTTIRYDVSTDIGTFGAVLDTSYLSKFRTTSPNPAGGPAIVDDRAGKGDQPRSTYPHWKGQASLHWSEGPASLLWRARYIGESTDVVNPVKDAKTRPSPTTTWKAATASIATRPPSRSGQQHLRQDAAGLLCERPDQLRHLHL